MARFSHKLAPPRERSAYISREEALSRVRDADLALVLAPPGYGKTSLLADLWRRGKAEGRAVAWLTVDEEDDARSLFLPSLARAIRSAMGEGRPEDRPGGAAVWTDGANLADALISEMAGSDEELLLIVDNVHWLSDSESVAALGQIMKRGGLRLALGGRFLPDELSNFVPWTEVALVSAEDLRLNAEETQTLYAKLTGGVAAPGHELYVTSEGWPAGIMLMVLSRGANGAGVSAAPNPQSSYMRNLCAALTDEEVARLSRLSIFSSFTPELAALVLPEISAEGFLTDVAGRCALIERGRRSMRFHPMLREYLSGQLAGEGEGIFEALHAQASVGLLKAGHWREAVHHALSGGRSDLAEDIIVAHAPEMLSGGDLLLLLKWCERLKPRAGASSRRLRMVEAWVYALTYKFPEALQLLDELASGDISAEDPEFAREATVVRATALVLGDATSRARALIREASSGKEPDDLWVREVLQNLLAYLDLVDGEFERVRTLPPCDLPIKRAFQACFIAQSWVEQGRLRTAHRRFTEAFDRARRAHDEDQTMAALVFAFHAPTLFALGEHGTLVERWFRYEAQIRETCPHDAMQAAVIARAQVDAEAGRLDAAQERLEAAVVLARQRGWMRLDAACCAERARLWLKQGDAATAGRLLDKLKEMTLRNDIDAVALADIMLQARLTEIRLDIALRRAASAADKAAALVEECTRKGRTLLAMRARVLLGAALGAGGDAVGAERARRPAQGWADAEGARILLALEASDFAGSVKAEPADEATNPLNPRELEVINLAAGGRTNKEIARSLSISPETVKWHLKNIYGKLYVGNRVEAIASIQRLRALQSA